jgi:hypothetical protein
MCSVSPGIIIGADLVIKRGDWSDHIGLKLGCNIARRSKVISCISAFGALLSRSWNLLSVLMLVLRASGFC